MPAPPEINRDDLAPFPELVAVRTAAQRGDWAGVRAAYAILDAETDRTTAVRIVGEVTGAERFLDPAADDETDTLARTMLARRHVAIGWTARGRLPAQHVSARQFAAFHDHLRRAEQLLIDVTAREPDNLAAWTTRLMTARGLGLGLSEAERRWAHIARHDPHHFPAQAQLLQQLCPKWSGTLDKLHAFARDRAEAAPPGSLSPVLVVQAHLEHWVNSEGYERANYLRSPQVQQSVADAARKSVLHPDFRPVYGWANAHSYFALLQSSAENWAAAAIHFRAAGPYIESDPWVTFYGDGEQQFHRHRKTALAKG